MAQHSDPNVGFDMQAYQQHSQIQQMQCANIITQPMMVPTAGQYYVVNPVPQFQDVFQRNGVTYYGAAALEKQRTHQCFDSIRQHYMAMNSVLDGESGMCVASALSAGNAVMNDSIMVQPQPTPIHHATLQQPAAAIYQQAIPQIAIQQNNYQSCYPMATNCERVSPQRTATPVFYSQPATPSPSIIERNPFNYVNNGSEVSQSTMPRAYSQPVMGTVTIPPGLSPLNHSPVTLGAPPGFRQLSRSTEDMECPTEQQGLGMSRVESSLGVLREGSVPSTPSPYQPPASGNYPTPSAYQAPNTYQAPSNLQVPSVYPAPTQLTPIVTEDGHLLYMQQQYISQMQIPLQIQPSPVMPAPSTARQQYVGGYIQQQQPSNITNKYTPCLQSSTMNPFVFHSPPRPLVAIPRREAPTSVMMSPLRLPTVRIANPRFNNLSRRQNLVPLTASPLSYNVPGTSRLRTKPPIILTRKIIKDCSSEIENASLNGWTHELKSKHWGQPPPNEGCSVHVTSIPQIKELNERSENEDEFASKLKEDFNKTRKDGDKLGKEKTDQSEKEEKSPQISAKLAQLSVDEAKTQTVNIDTARCTRMTIEGNLMRQGRKTLIAKTPGLKSTSTNSISEVNNHGNDEGRSPPTAQRSLALRQRSLVECAFCRSKGEPSEVFQSHSLRNMKTGITICPKLRLMSCPLCQATGDNAHTAFFCPLNRIRGRTWQRTEPTQRRNAYAYQGTNSSDLRTYNYNDPTIHNGDRNYNASAPTFV